MPTVVYQGVQEIRRRGRASAYIQLQEQRGYGDLSISAPASSVSLTVTAAGSNRQQRGSRDEVTRGPMAPRVGGHSPLTTSWRTPGSIHGPGGSERQSGRHHRDLCHKKLLLLRTTLSYTLHPILYTATD